MLQDTSHDYQMLHVVRLRLGIRGNNFKYCKNLTVCSFDDNS